MKLLSVVLLATLVLFVGSAVLMATINHVSPKLLKAYGLSNTFTPLDYETSLVTMVAIGTIFAGIGVYTYASQMVGLVMKETGVNTVLSDTPTPARVGSKRVS